MAFTKGDLQYTYSWTASLEGDNARITGFPDNVLLDRNESYEVLPFINRYTASRSWSLLNSFYKIETAIRISLPGEIRGHRTIKEWLDKNV
jgi:hypothetical protein